MHTNHAIRLATAPVSWGVWEATIDRPDLPPPDELLQAMRRAGFSRLELGPPGYFGSTPGAVEQTLRGAGMTLVGAFAPLHLSDADAFERDRGELVATIEALARFADDGPLVLLADAGSPERMSAAGKPAHLEATALDDEGVRRAAARLDQAAGLCRDGGLRAAFHHHAESYFEAPQEVDALLARTDPDLVGVCLDTGHAVIGGGDPVALMEAWSSRVTHVHLKDVDPGILAQLRDGEVTIENAWENGLFCPLGQGVVDFPRFFALPAMRAFEGVRVIEQDRIAVTAGGLAAVEQTETENLAYVTRVASA
jgi:inosose dehydratase